MTLFRERKGVESGNRERQGARTHARTHAEGGRERERFSHAYCAKKSANTNIFSTSFVCVFIERLQEYIDTKM